MATHPDPQGTVRYQIVITPEQRLKLKANAIKEGFNDVKEFILIKCGVSSPNKKK